MSKARDLIENYLNGSLANPIGLTTGEHADAIILALRAAGLVVVPVEMSDQHFEAAHAISPHCLLENPHDPKMTCEGITKEMYRAAIAASQEDK